MALTIQELANGELRVPERLEDGSETRQWSTISCRGSERYRDAGTLYALWFAVPDQALAEFDGWYEEEHTSLLLACEEWMTVRRFAGSPAVDGVNRLVLHHLLSAKALDSDARRKARATPAACRLLDQGWFQGAEKRLLRRAM
ncbi:MAG: hypothetical protein AB7G13_09125 [Lautropia sp.]